MGIVAIVMIYDQSKRMRRKERATEPNTKFRETMM